jgi:hypothetical protein
MESHPRLLGTVEVGSLLAVDTSPRRDQVSDITLTLGREGH